MIADVIRGAGHFLGHPQTLAMMQTEYTYPLVGDRLSPDDWMDAGAKSAVDSAHEYVAHTLRTHWPAHLGDEADRRIRDAFPIQLAHREDLRSNYS